MSRPYDPPIAPLGGIDSRPPGVGAGRSGDVVTELCALHGSVRDLARRMLTTNEALGRVDDLVPQLRDVVTALDRVETAIEALVERLDGVLCRAIDGIESAASAMVALVPKVEESADRSRSVVEAVERLIPVVERAADRR